MTAHWVKAKRPRSKPDTGGRKPAAANVAHDHADARYAVELTKQAGAIITAKVMEQLRAHHDVHRPVCHGERERIGAYDWKRIHPRGDHERIARVEPHRLNGDSSPCRTLTHASGDVAQSRSDVEQRQPRTRMSGKRLAEDVVQL